MARDFVRTIGLGTGTTRDRFRLELLPDPILMVLLFVLMAFGLMVLYSALHEEVSMVESQALKLGAGVVILLVLAHIHPREYLQFAPFVYVGGVLMLILVLVVGDIAKGGQRWLDLGPLPRFQPSEILKLAVPLTVASYLHDRKLPPGFVDVLVSLAIISVPVLLIVVQPDLGTGLLVASAGGAVLFLAGLPWRWLLGAGAIVAAAAPILWTRLHDYQQQRILTLFDPESDPLGAGWNIIQSTTAIGSGGLAGKGLLQGTQSRLDFLPEAQTDFILAVIGEELGMIGVCLFLFIYLLIVLRCMHIAMLSKRTYDRLVAGSIGITFFIYVFVNVGMVCGLLPVVGVPLPLVSYGGTSALTLLATFGVLLSVYKYRNG
ncbi:MAG: rod shape-determining protein RodA [Pseudomonadales bacterium]